MIRRESNDTRRSRLKKNTCALTHTRTHSQTLHVCQITETLEIIWQEPQTGLFSDAKFIDMKPEVRNL